MQLLTAPEPFSPAFGEILYAVSLQEEEKGEEISIFNSSVTEKIGIKKATEAPVFTMHVSDYVRSQIRIRPFPRQDSGIIEAAGRTWYSCIAHRNWASVNPHTAGVVAAGLHEPLSDSGFRTLAEDEQDEICWVSEVGSVAAQAVFTDAEGTGTGIGLGQVGVGEARMLALVLNAPHLVRMLEHHGKRWEEFRRFAVQVSLSGQVVLTVEYRIRAHNCNKVRLAWWNRLGGIDFYSFEVVRREEYTIDKKQVTLDTGKRNLSAQGRREWSVATAATTRERTRWLARIGGAPQVWMEEGGEFVPVEIMDLTFPVYHSEHTEVGIRFRESASVAFQSF